jgi:hypothetical protein
VRRLVPIFAIAVAVACPPLLRAAPSTSARDPFSRVKVGDTAKRVKRVLGDNYRICKPTDSGDICKDPVWLYQVAKGKPLGVAVRFHKGRVIAVFRLGAVQGWH